MTISTAILLLEIDAWTGAGVETLRLGTRTVTTAPSDTPSNTVYQGRIVDPGKLSCSISIKGGSSRSSGAIILNNQDGALDDWFGFGFDGREFRLKEIPAAGSPVSSATLLFRGSIAGVGGSNALQSLELKIRDKLADLDVPLLTSRYLGTTLSAGPTAEGNEALADRIRPRAYGFVRDMAPVRVNDFNLLDQWSDRAVSAIVVRDGGASLTLTQDYPNLSTLVAAPIPGGSYATCLALAITRLGADPARKLTGDVTEGATLAQRSAARVAQRILADAGIADVDAASFDAWHAAAPGETGFLISDSDGVSGILQEVMAPEARLVPSLAGQLRAMLIADPALGTPIDTLTQRDIAAGATFGIGAGLENSDDAIPSWRSVLRYGRVWAPLATGDVLPPPTVSAATAADLAQQYRYASEPDEAVKIAHPRAGEFEETTMLTSFADAKAQSVRRLALNKVRRDTYRAPVLKFSRGMRELGDVITLRTDRLGTRIGKSFMVYGREIDFRKRVVTLDLWG